MPFTFHEYSFMRHITNKIKDLPSPSWLFPGARLNSTVLTIIRIRVQMAPMIVCVCKAVSDRHIRSAVNGGISCVRELSRQTGLGTCCGKCVPEARATLAG